jgi:hypothetical protein
MTSRTKRRILGRQPEIRLKAAPYWLTLSVALCAVAFAEPPPAAPPAPPPPEASPDASNDEFIEFLGTDDVGDAAWWEFLKKSAPPRKDQPPAPPPQDAKQ